MRYIADINDVKILYFSLNVLILPTYTYRMLEVMLVSR